MYTILETRTGLIGVHMTEDGLSEVAQVRNFETKYQRREVIEADRWDQGIFWEYLFSGILEKLQLLTCGPIWSID